MVSEEEEGRPSPGGGFALDKERRRAMNIPAGFLIVFDLWQIVMLLIENPPSIRVADRPGWCCWCPSVRADLFIFD